MRRRASLSLHFSPISFLKVRDHGRRPYQFLPLLSSRALLIHSASVQSLISSDQCLLGLPRTLSIRPWSIDFVRYCALTMCPKYFSFCLRTSVMKSRFEFTCVRTDMLVLCSVQLIRIIFPCAVISHAANPPCLLSLGLSKLFVLCYVVCHHNLICSALRVYFTKHLCALHQSNGQVTKSREKPRVASY